jgi:hypothetical protein
MRVPDGLLNAGGDVVLGFQGDLGRLLGLSSRPPHLGVLVHLLKKHSDLSIVCRRLEQHCLDRAQWPDLHRWVLHVPSDWSRGGSNKPLVQFHLRALARSGVRRAY